ncbi:MAG: CUAEP/CCAEP-tail radical SAM (seleno)protein, partial [Terriglobia bacterium]
MNVVLISTYEMGRQPFGLASPAAWLRSSGMRVTCLDLSRDSLDATAVGEADLVGFYVPMHTATRLAVEALGAVRRLNSRAHVCFYGLYAPMNGPYLRRLGAHSILGGEFEEGLLSTALRVEEQRLAQNTLPPARSALEAQQVEPVTSLARLRFLAPDRRDLPPLARYARLDGLGGEPRVTGYTEASRGCKHLCRHCPVVPVYGGRFRVVQSDVVLEDVRRQVALGAEHITFGDPDFFNGIRHAIELVAAMHTEHPGLTYDVTIKVEHLLAYARHLETLRETGCLFVTTAAEAVDDHILKRLDKGHNRADFERVVGLFRRTGLGLAPTWVAFTPWTTLEGYCDLLDAIADLGIVEQVAPVQLGIRLLIPAGSRLLELDEVRSLTEPFREAE